MKLGVRYKLGIIIIIALIVRLFRITEMIDWTGAKMGILARNYLYYGYIETKFGAVRNVIDGSFVYYANHPPTPAIVLSFLYRIFGIHECVNRGFTITLGLLSIILLFLIVKKIWDEDTAIYASFIAALLPITAVFDREGGWAIVLFFVCLMVYSYLRWSMDNNKRYFLVLIIATIFGGMMDWIFYPIIGCLTLYHLIIYKNKKIEFFVVPLIALLIFIGMMFYLQSLHSPESLQHAGTKWIDFSIYTNWHFYSKMIRDAILQFTSVIILLSLIYLWNLASNWRKVPKEKSLLILILFIYGLFLVVALPKGALVHRCYLYLAAPAMIISSALGLKSLPKNVYAPILVVFIILSGYSFIELHNADRYDDYNFQLANLGKYINSKTSADDTILISTERAVFFDFYADRPSIATVNRSEFNILLEKRPDYVIISTREFDVSEDSINLSEEYELIGDAKIPGVFKVWKLKSKK